MSDTIAPITHERYTLIHGDSTVALAEMPEASVGLVVTSPPFADLFVYSRDEADLGNNKPEAFNLAWRCFTEQLRRVVAPGRIVALHTTQLLAYKNIHGFVGLRDFCGDVSKSMAAAGFEYCGDVSINKNPQSAAQRMHLHNLLFVTLRKDSTKSMPVRNDYLMVFRAPGDNAVPVKAFERGDVTEDDWIRWASGVWDDIEETNVLKTDGARTEEDEKHVCPLQLGLIERCLRLWSNPGELLLDPFSGVGSCGVAAMKLRRRYLGIDLKRENVLTAAKTLRDLVNVQDRQLSLFGGAL
jgi:DNA modification methylase